MIGKSFSLSVCVLSMEEEGAANNGSAIREIVVGDVSESKCWMTLWGKQTEMGIKVFDVSDRFLRILVGSVGFYMAAFFVCL